MNKNNNNLIKLLSEHNLTQTELSILVNVTFKTINRIISGKEQPGVLLAMKIARVFEVQVEDIWQLPEPNTNIRITLSKGIFVSLSMLAVLLTIYIAPRTYITICNNQVDIAYTGKHNIYTISAWKPLKLAAAKFPM